MKAMIFAAGLGTRLQPTTYNKPKALVEVGGKPLLEHLIRRLAASGFDQIIINVHHFASQIIDFLQNNNNFGIEITISDESARLLDTGGGLKKAAPFFDDEAFLLHNVDVISDIDLAHFLAVHRESRALATLAVRGRHSSRYLLFNHDNELCGWKNANDGTIRIVRGKQAELIPLAFSGIHAIDPQIFTLMPAEEKFSIIELYLALARKQKIVAYDHSPSYWQDVGNPQTLALAEKYFTPKK